MLPLVCRFGAKKWPFQGFQGLKSWKIVLFTLHGTYWRVACQNEAFEQPVTTGRKKWSFEVPLVVKSGQKWSKSAKSKTRKQVMGNRAVLIVNRPCRIQKWPLLWPSRPPRGLELVKNSRKVSPSVTRTLWNSLVEFRFGHFSNIFDHF